MTISKIFFALFFVFIVILGTFVPVKFPFVYPFIPPLPNVEVTLNLYGLVWGTYISNLQLISVIMTAFFLGPRLGTFSQIIYLTLGFSGIPIFYLGGGLDYFKQPTVGYLISFIPVTIVTGLIAFKNGNLNSTRAKNPNWLVLAGLCGLLLCHLIGGTIAIFMLNSNVWEVILTYILLPLPAQISEVVILSILISGFHYVRFGIIKNINRKKVNYVNTKKQQTKLRTQRS